MNQPKRLMKIEAFVSKSLGEWISMRSGHSLAFKQFEQVVSKINIQELSMKNKAVIHLIEASKLEVNTPFLPFKICWEAESDWGGEGNEDKEIGESIMIPIPNNESEGLLIRGRGYTEKDSAVSTYKFLSDETFILKTAYKQTVTEERIWFISQNVRCRSSIIRASSSSGILQTSFASEVRILKGNSQQV